jgi:GTP-dependent phosphoenolpyruvate carboxykinase
MDIKDLDLKGLNIKKEKIKELLYFDKQGWLKELNEVKVFFKKFEKDFPVELWYEFNKMYRAVQE